LKYLLDTHTLLWVIDDNPQLSRKVRNIFLDEDNDIYISMASIWEMAIKISLKKLEIPGNLSYFVNEHIHGNNIEVLSIQLTHIYQLELLPFHHRDPFDRLIISQAISEHLPVLSYDYSFDPYSVERIW